MEKLAKYPGKLIEKSGKLLLNVWQKPCQTFRRVYKWHFISELCQACNNFFQPPREKAVAKCAKLQIKASGRFFSTVV